MAEKLVQQYIREHITPNVTYCSIVRQLTSVGVAKVFAHYPQYFETFTSDNGVFRVDPTKRPVSRWSLDSPKSLSSFILLAPWLSEADLLRIFGADLMNETSLERLLLELTGKLGEPPLDCVGTTEELVASLNVAAGQGKFADSALVEVARAQGVIKQADWVAQLERLAALQPEQALPDGLRQAVEAELIQELSA